MLIALAPDAIKYLIAADDAGARGFG